MRGGRGPFSHKSEYNLKSSWKQRSRPLLTIRKNAGLRQKLGLLFRHSSAIINMAFLLKKKKKILSSFVRPECSAGAHAMLVSGFEYSKESHFHFFFQISATLANNIGNFFKVAPIP